MPDCQACPDRCQDSLERVAAFDRNAWSRAIGLPGRNHRNPQPGRKFSPVSDGARAFWIEAYGGRPYRVDRVKHAEPILVQRLTVAWHGGIQPQRLAEVMRGADDGLLARFMWFWPEPVPFHIANRPPEIDWAIVCFDSLRTLELVAGNNGPRPLTVPAR